MLIAMCFRILTLASLVVFSKREKKRDYLVSIFNRTTCIVWFEECPTRCKQKSMTIDLFTHGRRSCAFIMRFRTEKYRKFQSSHTIYNVLNSFSYFRSMLSVSRMCKQIDNHFTIDISIYFV